MQHQRPYLIRIIRAGNVLYLPGISLLLGLFLLPGLWLALLLRGCSLSAQEPAVRTGEAAVRTGDAAVRTGDAAGQTAGPAPPAGVPVHEEEADRIRKDTFFTRLFQGTGEGFTGGDGTYSVPLPDGRTVWIFGDTFIGGVNPDGKTRYRQTPIYIRNSMVVQDGTELETLYREHNNRNASWIIHPYAIRKDGSLAEDSIWFWPGDGYCEGEQLKVFLSEFIRTGQGMWDFQWTGTWLAVFGLPGLEQRELMPVPQGLDAGAHLGHALLEDGQYIHVYGSGDGKPYAARFPQGRVTGPWEFYDGQSWTGDPSEAKPMGELDVSEQFSVFQQEDLYVLLTQKGISDQIVSYTSETPYGPWGKPTLLYETPIPDSTGNLFTYNALAHPQFTEEKMLLVSYNMNSMRLEDLYRNTGIYRPRFIRIPLEMIDPSPDGRTDQKIFQR